MISTSAIIPLSVASTKAAGNAAGGAFAAQQMEESSDGEELKDQPPKARLSWDGVRDDGSVINVRGALLRLRLENLTTEHQQLELALRADDGGARNIKLNLGSARLDALGSAVIPVNAHRVGFNLNNILFSGRLQATARVTDDAGGYIETSISPPVFFHPVGPVGTGSVAFYGKQALQEQFNGGDFRGRGGRDLADDTEGAILTRVMDAGAGNASEASFREAQAKAAEDVNDSGAPRAAVKEADSLNLKAGTQEATAANKYRTCIMFRIQTTDSGGTIDNGPNKGGTEDHWTAANAGMDVPAYGVHVRIKKNGV